MLSVEDDGSSPLDISGSFTLESGLNLIILIQFQTIMTKSSAGDNSISYGISKNGNDDLLRVAANPDGIFMSDWHEVQKNTSIPSEEFLDGDWVSHCLCC